jgi:methionyl aminopeptidase
VAREVLEFACSLAVAGRSTDSIDAEVHAAILRRNVYPAPLNYRGFPKSLCAAVNEEICHGIPNDRPLENGDIAKFDVSIYTGEGYFGDNCATVVVGGNSGTTTTTSSHISSNNSSINNSRNHDDHNSNSGGNSRIGDSGSSAVEWKWKKLENREESGGERLARATRESVAAALETCRPGGDLRDIGAAVDAVANAYGYQSVEKYCGHGIGRQFHMLPYVQHFRNSDALPFREGMVFTIEPMLVEGSSECRTLQDGWTVVTLDDGRAAQYEHMVSRTEGKEIPSVS